MAAEVMNDKRAGAEVYHGHEISKKKALEFLQEAGMPRGLLPLQGVEECGYVRATGFFWLKRKQKFEYQFKSIGKLVCYAAELTGYVEKHKMKKLTGVKCKELLIWLTITDISIDDPSSGKIYFKTSTGLGSYFPVEAYEVDHEDE